MKVSITKVFSTSFQTIAFIQFPVGITPYLGMKIVDVDKDLNWVVSDILFGGSGAQSIKLKSERLAKNIWDCALSPINHNMLIEEKEYDVP